MKPVRLIVATRNKKKLQEIKALLKDLPFSILSLEDFPDAPEIEETGKTFEENAILKSATIAQYYRVLTLGEDSGLEVRALGGRPGVYSSRYSGPGATDKKNNAKLLKELKRTSVSKRGACYVCAAALSDASGFLKVFKGKCRGSIAKKPSGKNGFGYDPLFIVPKYKKTLGVLDPEIKHSLSHRFYCLTKLKAYLQTYLKKYQ